MNTSNAVSMAPERDCDLARAFDVGVSKIQRNLPDLAANPMSWAFDPGGDYPAWGEGFFDIGNWTTSFFTGMGLLAFLKTGDRAVFGPLDRLAPFYREKVGRHVADTMHDLGFLYSLYSVALYKTTGEEMHREVGLEAARALADRFVPEGAYIRAWGRMDELDSDYAGLAIIDCLMNMPLLYWASDESGDPRFREIAIRHTDTTLRYFLREDGSPYHAFRFDPVDGNPLGGDNYCGRGVESHWARGTGWAMYGFALGFAHTDDPRYLNAALSLGKSFAKGLDGDSLPLWDFKLEPGDPEIRDSSASAIVVCAVQLLESLGRATPEMCEMKELLLARLCSADCLDRSMECRGLIKQGQVGDGIGVAQAVYVSWGDYFFMQALASELGMGVNWW